MEWQDIESAPKGWLLVYTEKGHFIAFMKHDGTWQFDGESDESADLIPTHWMPLPPPPSR